MAHTQLTVTLMDAEKGCLGVGKTLHDRGMLGASVPP